ADRRSPLRTPVLATVGADGVPDARIVVLRDVSPGAATLCVHTDLRTKKVKDLQTNPSATFCAWATKYDLQIRIKALATILSGPDVMSSWQSMSDPARRVYGGTPAPGVLLAHPSEVEGLPDPAAFAILRCDIREIETLHLGADLHRRARFRREDAWQGAWLAP
ncbi:MAG: pyridoxamine 5'-phosphate oxidase family protein, partial [Paracoccaceae bacterium]|nr:pyridoxamine 5'-phosphate oxidase family protein [Paracoccaceae bacterium]